MFRNWTVLLDVGYVWDICVTLDAISWHFVIEFKFTLLFTFYD